MADGSLSDLQNATTAPGNERMRGRRGMRFRGMLAQGCVRMGEGKNWQGTMTMSMVFILKLTSGMAKWAIVVTIPNSDKWDEERKMVETWSL